MKIKYFIFIAAIGLFFGCSNRALIISQKGGERDLSKKTESEKAEKSNNNEIKLLIESEPKDARVFWKVVSSTDEVSNTGELYLGKTPIKENKILDIKGLSENNAANVNIELIIKLPDHKEEKKRFVAKQIMETKEISAFFDLKKKED
ncbi:MAG TPA: hypothetical protein DHW82_03820 [Spirochaetia bacterium]|nr:MAG: hypothetical protein A2Y41_06820 [Spirochaetes bacterium GWB1_36_13]HCL56121.1 hypothetical protein [Spirochaetia bacterium]